MARRALLVGLAGVIVGISLVGAVYGPHVSGPIQVRFDGVALTTTYLNGSSTLFGPAHQNACNETFPAGPGWPSTGPDCPALLTGGTQYDLYFFETGNPGYSPGLWANMTVRAPFDFAVEPGVEGSIPTTYSAITGLYTGGANLLFDHGEWSGWGLVFTMPDSFPSHPSGLWLNATLTVQPTNQTYYPGS